MTPRIKKMQDDKLLRNLRKEDGVWRCTFWTTCDDVWEDISNPSLKGLLRFVRTARVMKKRDWPESFKDTLYYPYPFRDETDEPN